MSSPTGQYKITSHNLAQHNQVPNMYIHFITANSGFRYCVTQSPDPNNLQNYKDFFLSNGIKTLVKLCECNRYDIEYLEHNGIKVIDIPLQDGTTPSKDIIKKWIDIIKQEIKNKNNSIAVHCMSGLGRAPLFVCVGLVMIDKIDPIDAITIVRKTIRSALNTNQINFLRSLHYSNDTKKGCIIC